MRPEGPTWEVYAQMADETALTLDDVTLIPRYSTARSRGLIDTSTIFANGIRQMVPIYAANMDSVMNPEMAIAMARSGAVGVLPRFMNIEDQVAELLTVKKDVRLVIESPFTLPDTTSLSEAEQILKDENMGGALISDASGANIGLLTRRDIKFYEQSRESVVTRMKKKEDIVTAPLGISIDSAKAILAEKRIEKLPLTDEQGNIVAMMTTQGIEDFENMTFATKDSQGRLAVATAVGVQREDFDRASALVENGTDAIVVDIAHGDSIMAVEMVQRIRAAYPSVHIIAGNVVTAEAAERLIDAGADTIKVGVGPGAFCITREQTGNGEGNWSATIGVAGVTHKRGAKLITDGGFENPGQMVRALAAGADGVMAGTLFVGTDESPARLVNMGGILFKIGFGNASREGEDKRLAVGNKRRAGRRSVEGISAPVPFMGAVAPRIETLHQGIQSGFSYQGAESLNDLHEHAVFKRVGSGYAHESRPRADYYGGWR